MFGREKQHHWLDKPGHYRIATIGAWIFGGLMMILILTALVAAFVG